MNLCAQGLTAAFALALFDCEAANIGPLQAVSTRPAALVSESPASGSSTPVLSADGRYVAFISRAPNLVTNPTTGSYQVFLREQASSHTILVSAAGTQSGGNDHSLLPSLSSNGLHAAFESEASDLVDGDTNDVSDIFVRDVVAMQTLLVSGGNGLSRNPLLSADGRYVAFESRASNLVAGDNNAAPDVFVRDLLLGVTTLVSLNVDESGSANGSSELLTMTRDGRFVAFWSNAPDIAADTTNTIGEIYVRDVTGGITYCLTESIAVYSADRRFKIALTPDGRYAALQELNYGGAAAGGRAFHADVFGGSIASLYCCGRPGSGLAISEDGQQVVFPGNDGLYLRELSSTNRLLVHDPAAGFQMPLTIASFQVSRDFQRLWFTMLVTNRGQQLFSYDLPTGQTTLISTNLAGEPMNAAVSSPFSISGSGAVVAFETVADDLVVNDLNRAPDVFVSNAGPASRRHPALPETTGLGYATLHAHSVSANGQRVAFLSTDSSLISLDTNGHHDVFVRDLAANQVFGVALSPSNSAMAAVISADGASVVYERILGGPEFISSGWRNVHRADLRTGENRRLDPSSPGGLQVPSLSVSQDGRWVVSPLDNRIRLSDFRTPGQVSNQIVDLRYTGVGNANGPSSRPAISLDGEWVVFLSRATDLVNPGADGGTGVVYPSGVPQVFARHLRQRRTRLLSITDAGAPLPTGATNPLLSANARYVAFETLSGSNIYRHDLLATGRVTNPRVCTACSQPSISADGRMVAYQSQGRIYVRDVQSAVTESISDSESKDATISPDGRLVVYVRRVSDDAHVYLYDRWKGVTHLLSINYFGTAAGNGPSGQPVFSHDSRTIAFQSFASDLVPGDYNGRRDIFVVQIEPVDTDGDGMDDDWEQFHFQSLVRDGFGNVDGDHQTDKEEFLAGTDPLDPASSLHLTGISSRPLAGPMQDTELTWTSAPGKTYRVQHKPDLAAPWSDLPGDVIPGGPSASRIHLDDGDPPAQNRFYRIMLVD